VIRKVLEDLAILRENVYNIDETGVMLSMLGSVKVLVSRKDLRDYRGARVKRIVVTAIECISADGRYLDPGDLASDYSQKQLDNISHAGMALRMLRIWVHRFLTKFGVAHARVRSAD